MSELGRISKKWQKAWAEDGIFKVDENSPKPKYYVLEMYPYPSGSGLHMGHARNYTIGDVYARYKRMQGYNVLYPMGYDSFGLPAENAAIKAKSHPKIFTEKAIENFVRQQKELGLSYDWDRMVACHQPSYYRWDQWVFLKMREKGLVFKKVASVNWCPKCQTVLANEQVHSGRCWRHEDTQVEVKSLSQWFFRITDYAQELLDGIDTLENWPEDVKTMQRNWIGRSEGTLLEFDIEGMPGKKVTVFTTRPDTVYGITFLVYAPEHPDVVELVRGTKYEKPTHEFVKKILLEDKFERTAQDKEKEGLFIGRHAIHPLTQEKIPIYIANFVLYEYGTGAIQAVPAHDQRDFEFATKYKIPIKVVIEPKGKKLDASKLKQAYVEDGVMTNSGPFDRQDNRKAIPKINEHFEKGKMGKATVQYKLRDWLISRQRFWGCPIPIVYCDTCAKRKQKVLLIHGYGVDGKSLFFPHLASELEKQGFEVIAPNLPEPEHPERSAWLSELEKIDLGEDDIIIGHSLGGKAALHLLEKKKVGAVYLVAPATPAQRDWESFKAKYPKKDVDRISRFANDKVDLEKVKKNAPKRVVLLSDDDDRISPYTKGYFGGEWTLKEFKGRGHFRDSEFPELADEVAKDKKEPGAISVPEKDLPVRLPDDVRFEDKGGNPLEGIRSFVETSCPRCGGNARRETDTMDTFVDSSWYFLRYTDARNDHQIFDPKKANYWMPIDTYIGGREHATMHLIYFRFFTKFLRDLGLLKVGEPARLLFNQGMLHKGGAVMSKSKGNVVSQEEIEAKYGIDTARFYMMFLASPDKDMEWDDKAIEGTFRFLQKVMRLQDKRFVDTPFPNQMSKAHKTIKTVTESIEVFRYNQALISIMEFANYLSGQEDLNKEPYEILLRLMAPFTPHLCEELWELSGHEEFISLENWPILDESKIDKVIEAKEKLVESTISDILAVRELAKIDKLKGILIILSADWKYDLYKLLKIEMEKTRNPAELMRAALVGDLKQYGQDISKLIAALLKDPSKIPAFMLTKEQELDALSSAKPQLEKQFGVYVDFANAEESGEPKAKNAAPGKPAIILR